ncbi:MAG: hypothetical protein ACLQK4_10040 [Acidimicrobiales bacterium]|jgi:hypothetical protein
MTKEPELSWTDPHFLHVRENTVVVSSYPGPDGSVSVLRVQFDPESDCSVQSVTLSMPGRMTPTAIRRFPWDWWLGSADAMAREDADWRRRVMLDAPQEVPTKAAVGAGKRSGHGPTTQPRRPGRRGHPDSHYREVAARYVELRKAGVRNPTATIAAEKVVNRNTVAGWLRVARDRGYLPPARRGMAG